MLLSLPPLRAFYGPEDLELLRPIEIEIASPAAVTVSLVIRPVFRISNALTLPDDTQAARILLCICPSDELLPVIWAETAEVLKPSWQQA